MRLLLVGLVFCVATTWGMDNGDIEKESHKVRCNYRYTRSKSLDPWQDSEEYGLKNKLLDSVVVYIFQRGNMNYPITDYEKRALYMVAFDIITRAHINKNDPLMSLVKPCIDNESSKKSQFPKLVPNKEANVLGLFSAPIYPLLTLETSFK